MGQFESLGYEVNARVVNGPNEKPAFEFWGMQPGLGEMNWDVTTQFYQIGTVTE